MNYKFGCLSSNYRNKISTKYDTAHTQKSVIIV